MTQRRSTADKACDLEAQLEEAKRQSRSKLAAADKRLHCFKFQLIRHQNKSDKHVGATEQQCDKLP